MPAVPKRPTVPVRYMRRLMVYIANTAGTNPTEADAQPSVLCRSISWGVGNKLPSAVLEVNQADLGIRIGNEFVSKNMNRRVEVWLLKTAPDDSEPDTMRDIPLFWGEITASEMVMNGSGESRILSASVQPYHFGNLAQGQKVWNYRTDDTAIVDLDLEFNPLIDQKIKPNRVPENDPDNETIRNPLNYSIWVDPEAVRSQTAIEEYHSEPLSWELRDIVETLCELLNFPEADRLIKNPTGLSTLTRANATPPVKNLSLRRGGRLSDYLSELLPQFGYQWFVKFDRKVTDGKPTIQPKIVVYRRGDAPDEKELHIPAWGDNFDVETADAESLNYRYDVEGTINKIYAHAGLKQRELTIELYRAWSSDDDSAIADNTDTKNHIGRKWAANEAGDYFELREEIPDDPPELFGSETIPRRREIHDCLTLRKDDRGEGHRRPPYLEISTDNGETWRAANDLDDDPGTSDFGGWTPVPDELAIWITTAKVPEQLQETDPEKLRMRITCTVISDERLTYTTERDQDSPTSADCSLLLNLSDKYGDRKRESSGEFRSRLTGDADTQDDTAELETFVDRLLKLQRGAQVTAAAQCPQIRTDFAISDLLTGVRGRSISFNRLARSAGDAQFLQVVGITFENNENQHTTLHVERFDA